MKVWIYSLVFAVSSLAVSSQTCPSDHFSAIFVATVEQTLDFAEPAIDDPELYYFKSILKFRDNEIEHTFKDAIQFYNDTYGLDFSGSTRNKRNELFYENAILGPWLFHPEIDFLVNSNNWIQTGRTHTSCFLLTDGGLRVSFSGDQILYGSYGGAEGKPAGVANFAAYGYYTIVNLCEQSQVLIQLQTVPPLRSEPIDGFNIFHHELYSPVLGYGTAEGYNTIRPDPDEPGKFRFTVRNVLSFPA